MTIKIGTTFHDGYDKINAKWKVTKKLPHDTWVCQIQDKQLCNVIQIYHEDIINTILDYEARVDKPNKCLNCKESIGGGYLYCEECEWELVS